MQRLHRALSALFPVLALGLLSVPATAADETVRIEMKDRDGKDVGTITIAPTAAGALIRVKLSGLPPGPHGFHFHETGSCEGNFSSAGAIYNPLGATHGYLNEEGPMSGDLTNLHADSSGKVEAELLSPFVTLTKDTEESIFDADGSSLVIFENADDYLTDPEGNAGARLACGAITPARQ